MRLFVRLVAAVAVIAALAAGGAWVWLDRSANTPLDPRGAAAEPREIRVPKGATLSQVGQQLQEEKLISSAFVWKLWVRVHGGPSPKAGRHPVHAGMTIPELLVRLAETPLSDDVPLTFVEGWRLRDADAALAADKRIEPGAYLAAASSPAKFRIEFPLTAPTLEGYLYPETYMVPLGPIDVERVIQRQLDKFAEKFWLPNKAEIEKSGRSLHDLVTMASMLEREEPTPSLRPQVAGVLYRRLDAKTPLGVDATSRYKLAEWNDRKSFLVALRDPADTYNTRLRAGLPPGPIGAPAIESLMAALRPEKSEYWYYLHDADRNIHFSRTAEEHEAARRKYNVW